MLIIPSFKKTLMVEQFQGNFGGGGENVFPFSLRPKTADR